MSVDYTPQNTVVTLRESTRRIECECPYGGPNMLNLHRETAELDAEGNLIRLQSPWKHISKSATDIAKMTFTRPDGSTFTGLSMMMDMQVACDQLANEVQE